MSLVLTGCIGTVKTKVKLTDKKGNEYSCTTTVSPDEAKAEGKKVDLECEVDVKLKQKED